MQFQLTDSNLWDNIIFKKNFVLIEADFWGQMLQYN